MKVVGFEGSWDSTAVISCAAAAIADDATVTNSTTKRRVPLAELVTLEASGHLFLLKKALPVDDAVADRDLVVVAVRTNLPLASYFLIDTGRVGGLVAHERAGSEQYYVFTDDTALNVYRDEVCLRVVEDVLSNVEQVPAEHIELIRWCVALNPRNPFVQALRVFVAPGDQAYVRRLAAKSVAPERSQLFSELVDALLSGDLDYMLKYEQGAAEGGGFDVDIAASTLKAIDSIHDGVEPALLDTFPFLGESVPPPRFKLMIAASAEMHFRTKLDGRPLREKVARHLELRMINRILRGEQVPQLQRTRKIEEAISTVSQPTSDTLLKHRFDDAVAEAVVFESPPEQDASESPQLTVFGFQSGLIKDAARVELQIFPGFTLLLAITPSTDGQGTLGAEYLENEHDFLRKPLAVTLKRVSYGFDREVFIPLQIKVLEVGGSCVVDAFPSSIVDRAFVTRQSITISRRDEDTIDSPLGTLIGLSGRTKTLAAEWMKRFAAACYAFELEQVAPEPPHVLLPSRVKVAPARARVIVSLHRLGGSAKVSDLVNEINRRFDTVVRTNNTRREVIRHPNLLEFDELDDQSVRLTAKGSAFAKAYLAYGGDKGHD